MEFPSWLSSVIALDVVVAELANDRIAEAHHFDLLDERALHDACKHIVEKGTPVAVVLNAGWTKAESLADVTEGLLTDEMNLNFRSAAFLLRALVSAMRGLPSGGSFVFVSSVNATAHFDNPIYAAAKAAMHAWMRAIAAEEGKNGIRANVVMPGSIKTPAWAHRIRESPAIMDAVSRLYPLGRLVEPIEVANTVAFLASPLASGVTGAAVPVDAGISAGNLPFLDQIAGDRAAMPRQRSR